MKKHPKLTMHAALHAGAILAALLNMATHVENNHSLHFWFYALAFPAVHAGTYMLLPLLVRVMLAVRFMHRTEGTDRFLRAGTFSDSRPMKLSHRMLWGSLFVVSYALTLLVLGMKAFSA